MHGMGPTTGKRCRQRKAYIEQAKLFHACATLSVKATLNTSESPVLQLLTIQGTLAGDHT